MRSTHLQTQCSLCLPHKNFLAFTNSFWSSGDLVIYTKQHYMNKDSIPRWPLIFTGSIWGGWSLILQVHSIIEFGSQFTDINIYFFSLKAKYWRYYDGNTLSYFYFNSLLQNLKEKKVRYSLNSCSGLTPSFSILYLEKFQIFCVIYIY